MDPWFYWLMAGIILVFLELMFSGFVLLCFGFASVLTSFLSLLGLQLEGQIFSFIILTIIAFVTIRPFFLKNMKPKEGVVETNVYGLIGREGLVVETIPKEGFGKVKVFGDEWTAISKDGVEIRSGEKIKILAINGNKLIVKNLKQGA
jgi:membrane protein implicated in regulation of membrane protease activity